MWKHLKDVALMWLLMVGINLGVTLLMIPVVLLLMTLGGVIGRLPALIIGGLINLVTEGACPGSSAEAWGCSSSWRSSCRACSWAACIRPLIPACGRSPTASARSGTVSEETPAA